MKQQAKNRLGEPLELTPHCNKHPEQELTCPVCFAKQGRKALGKKYDAKKFSEWGRRGGPPRRYPQCPRGNIHHFNAAGLCTACGFKRGFKRRKRQTHA